MARLPRELKLSGVIASAVTPHRPEGVDADFSAALELLDFLAQGGATAIAVLDAPGEFLNFSLDDRQRLVYLGVKRSRVPLIAGVSHPTLSGALALAEDAIRSGADGLLVMPPCFFRYGQAEIGEFCREFAVQAGDAVPLILHNAPEVTSGLEPATIERLLDTRLFAAVADSSGDPGYFEGLLELKSRHQFALLCGDDRLAARALGSGADGLLSPGAGAAPELFAALVSGVPVEGLLAEFLDAAASFPTPAVFRRALELRGQKPGGLFVPLAPATAARLEEFSAWFPTWLARMKKEIKHG